MKALDKRYVSCCRVLNRQRDELHETKIKYSNDLEMFHQLMNSMPDKDSPQWNPHVKHLEDI